MEEKQYTQADLTAITNELQIQIKMLQDRNINLSVALSRTNEALVKIKEELNNLKSKES